MAVRGWGICMCDCEVMICVGGGGDNCKCPAIPPKDFTVQKDGCFQINSTFRYQCTTGYTRKPGTSGLIKCQEKNGVLQWTKSLFKCITDPNYQPPPTTTTGRKLLFFSLSLHDFCLSLLMCKHLDLRHKQVYRFLDGAYFCLLSHCK
uniref:Sushi domain-containing protein n=1 Tax=Xiphophorus couchianus TaxID=32473 RepID=A0A3B5LJ28_9TELE